MSSLSNSRTETEETTFLIERIARLFLFLFTISIFYLAWKAYLDQNYDLILVYSILYLVYLASTFLIIRDIYNNYEFFNQTKNEEGIRLIEEVHFLCSNPLCSRCGGWYWGLAISFTSALTLRHSIISVLQKGDTQGYYVVLIGSIIFLISTPVHGVLNFLTKNRLYNKIYSSTKTKTFFGLLSGLSIIIISIGVYMLI